MARLILVLVRIALLHAAVAFVVTFAIFAVRVSDRQDAELRIADERLQAATTTVRLLIEPTDPGITSAAIARRVGTYARTFDGRLSIHICLDDGTPLFESSQMSRLHQLIHRSEIAMIAPALISDGSRDYRAHWEHAGALHVTVAHEVLGFWETAGEMSSEFVQILMVTIALMLGGGLLTGLAVMRMIRRYGDYLQRQIDEADRQGAVHAIPTFSVGWQLFMGPIYEIVRRLHQSRNQALSFASYASHELRSPLTIMRHQLDEGLGEAARRSTLRRIIGESYDNVLRLQRTIEDLLSLATMQAGTYRLNRVSVEFNQMLRTFAEEARLLAKPNNVRIVLSRGPSAEVMLDLQRFRQVLFNLLDNALKYSSANSTIRIGCTVEPGFVVMTFSDNGRGISAEALPHVFEPFYRGSGSDDVRGSGLGLALVRWIMDLHGGSTAVSSDPGHGTTFTIKIPRTTGPHHV